jgi:chromosomal replication initiation ATPase DnaA
MYRIADDADDEALAAASRFTALADRARKLAKELTPGIHIGTEKVEKQRFLRSIILPVVAAEFGVTPVQILGRVRTERIVMPRFATIWILIRHGWPYSEAMSAVNRSREGAYHSLNAIRDRCETDASFRKRLASLMNKVGPAAISMDGSPVSKQVAADENGLPAT